MTTPEPSVRLPDEAIEAAWNAMFQVADDGTEISMAKPQWRAAVSAAYEAGRRDAVDGLTEIFAFQNGPTLAITAEDAAALKANRDRLYHAFRTEWRAVQAGDASC